MKSNDIILQTMTNVVLFIVLIFSIFIFFNGHHEPGGGFIGGLMTSSALVLLLLAYDLETVQRILPIDFKIVAAIGLLIAIGTGMGSFLFGAPFLSQTYDYFTFPVLGELELATALLFDIGVYLVVIGVTLTIIQTIGEDK
ncbi:Na(+)/H(+) antiporter subunit B [Salibacterium salarium]|uniref:Na(+)/H(+) antiporter subunit B n=1 Tax=Salibacterium salarium TaxID=284579 RepID=A0A428N7U5_9BACI|nr:Na(+)/H(+) antiporter subunit B [Salibacterium salarium]RSL34447.1 Na(+)/H(+) antiporter subunit B [Salibacterium salarium]